MIVTWVLAVAVEGVLCSLRNRQAFGAELVGVQRPDQIIHSPIQHLPLVAGSTKQPESNHADLQGICFCL